MVESGKKVKTGRSIKTMVKRERTVENGKWSQVKLGNNGEKWKW